MKLATTLSAVALLSFLAPAVQAGEVTVKGVHLCCGACVKAVGKALTGVDGVSDAACDRENQTVSFAAENDEAAQAGVNALAKAGFHGKAAHGDKKVEFPKSGAEKGDKVDKLVVEGVHICCPMCVKAIAKVLKPVAGGAELSCDRKAGSVTVDGEDVDVVKIVSALNNAGFHATVKK